LKSRFDRERPVGFQTTSEDYGNYILGFLIGLRSGLRKREGVKSRRIFCQIAVKKMGYSGADVARFLGITTSAVNRLAVSDELPGVENYL
jgi:hypothetical protein